MVKREINGVIYFVDPTKSSLIRCERTIAEKFQSDINYFIEELYSRGNSYTPMSITWELTNKCNFSCPFCYINNSGKRADSAIDINRLKQNIDFLVDRGLVIVYLTGGEVLSLSEFSEIYTYLKEKGVFVVLLTNLSLLTDQHISLFEKYPPFRVTVSIYGVSEEQFCSVTGQNWMLGQKILSNILLLKGKGINITCQTPINKLTIGDFQSISQWCYENGIKYNSNNELMDSYYGESFQSLRVDNELFVQEKALTQRTGFIVAPNRKAKLQFGYKHYFDCKAGKYSLTISHANYLRPCFNICDGSIPEFDASQSIERALNEMEEYIAAEQKKVVPYCHGCMYVDLCGQCQLTQNSHKDNLEEYMRQSCKKMAEDNQTIE